MKQMQVSIKISGMHCGGCVSSVKKAASSLKDVSDIEVSLENQQLTAEIANPERLVSLQNAIEDCGFDIVGTSG